jgi:hypothetical protein
VLLLLVDMFRIQQLAGLYYYTATALSIDRWTIYGF